MAWNITYHAQQPLNPQIGDMWPVPHWEDAVLISERYKADWAKKRPPLLVVLPDYNNKNNRDWFVVDRHASGDDAKMGWLVTIVGDLVDGQMPDITLEPSINCVGSYHGYIKHGVITDDCEGRVYPA